MPTIRANRSRVDPGGGYSTAPAAIAREAIVIGSQY
jgi:hypothetical protein